MPYCTYCHTRTGHCVGEVNIHQTFCFVAGILQYVYPMISFLVQYIVSFFDPAQSMILCLDPSQQAFFTLLRAPLNSLSGDAHETKDEYDRNHRKNVWWRQPRCSVFSHGEGRSFSNNASRRRFADDAAGFKEFWVSMTMTTPNSTIARAPLSCAVRIMGTHSEWSCHVDTVICCERKQLLPREYPCS